MMCLGIFNILASYGQITYKYTNDKIVSLESYKSGNIFQKDFLLFSDMLNTCHPAFSRGRIPPFDIDSINSAGYDWSKKCTSTSQFYNYLQAILTRLNDGHTTLLPVVDENLIYPFILFKDNNYLYLKGINKEYESSLGKRVIQINNQPALEVINSFRETISCDNSIGFYNKVNDFMQLYSIWKNHRYCLSDSTLKLQFADMETISLKPITKKEIKLVTLPNKSSNSAIRENTKQPFIYKILPEKNICYLQFNSCLDQSSLRIQYNQIKERAKIPENILEKKLSKIPRFDVFLDTMFKQIREGNIQTLVIDVRNNSGGNSKLCDILLSWLKPHNEINQYKSLIRFSKLWEQNYPLLADEYKQALINDKKTFVEGELYECSLLPNLTNKKESIFEKEKEYFRINTNRDLIFKGNIIFIQNARTYSSAGLLISTAMDNNIGIVIGSESAYSPCNYGDLLYWELPNTQIKGCMSHKIFIRPNITKCSESSLMPNVHLIPSWIEVMDNKDICWDWILSQCQYSQYGQPFKEHLNHILNRN